MLDLCRCEIQTCAACLWFVTLNIYHNELDGHCGLIQQQVILVSGKLHVDSEEVPIN